jgi:acetyl esterase
MSGKAICRSKVRPYLPFIENSRRSGARTMSPSGWKHETIAGADGKPLAARVYGASRAMSESTSLVLHLHAGAFVAGDLESGSRVASLLADAGAVVVSLGYPLAPAHPFPEATESVHAALVWMQRHHQRLLHADAHLFVAGEEAGGNLAAVAAMMSRDRHGPALAGQILFSPMLDVCVSTGSWRCIKAGPVGCPWADGWRQYLPRASDATHPYATPGSSMRLEGLPPTLLVTSQDDPLRDETRAFSRRLRAADVPVELVDLPMPTGWPASYVDPQPPASNWIDPVRDSARQFFIERVTARA